MLEIIPRQISLFVNCVKSHSLKFKGSSKLIFICGLKPNKDNPTARDLIKEYADKHLDSFQFFMAEDFFSAFENEKGWDLLSIEESLCNYSDCILIILKGESAFAELGAFALHPKLVKQVLVINEIGYKNGDSFIVKGPIAKVDSESIFTPTIHANFRIILNTVSNIEENLKKIERTNVSNISMKTLDELKKDPKKRILFLSDIISLFGPMRLFEVFDVLRLIYRQTDTVNKFSEIVDKKFIDELEVEIALLTALTIIKKNGVFSHRARNETWLFYQYPNIKPERIRAEVIVKYNKKSRDRINV